MKQMSVQMFILVCLLPLPGLMIFHVPKVWNKCKRMCYVHKNSDNELNTKKKSLELHQREVSQEEISSVVSETEFTLSLTDTLGITFVTSDSDTDIASEYSTDLLPHFKTSSEQGTLADSKHSKIRELTETNPQEEEKKTETKSKMSIELDSTIEEIMTHSDNNSKHSSELDTKDEGLVDSRDAITETLLKHYKTLKLFGISFNWFAVHKIYRMILVACNTYISNSIKKLCMMTSSLLCILLLLFILRPYKQKTGNVTAGISYIANCGIAMINLIKAVLDEYDCKINCSNKSNVLWYLDAGEQILLVYFPVASICLWLLITLLQKCLQKSKKE